MRNVFVFFFNKVIIFKSKLFESFLLEYVRRRICSFGNLMIVLSFRGKRIVGILGRIRWLLFLV